MSRTGLIVLGVGFAILTAILLVDYSNYRDDSLCYEIKTGIKSIQEIRQLLHDRSPYVRSVAAETLVALDDKESISEISKEMLKLLKDKRYYIRDSAVNILVYFGNKESTKKAIVEIRKLLNDKDGTVRSCAVSALAKFDNKESIPLIKKLLKDKDSWVSYMAEKALKQLGVPEEEIQKAKEGK